MPRNDRYDEPRYFDEEREWRRSSAARRFSEDDSYPRDEDDDRVRAPRYGAGYGDLEERRPGSREGYRQSDYGQRDFSQASRYGRDWRNDEQQSARNWSSNQYGRQYDRPSEPNRGFGSNQWGIDERSEGGQRYGQTSQFGSRSGQSQFGGLQTDVNGPHRGRGPKGYKRTDARVREDINDRLADDSHLDASDIEIEVKNGEVTLSGTVSDRQDKRRAEDLVENVSGVQHVQNNVRVKAQDSSELESERRTRQQT